MFAEQKCRACGRLFFWAITANKKRMPIDIEPNPAGNCEVSTAHGAPFVTVHKGPPGMLDDWTPFMTHFATCPDWYTVGHLPDSSDVATLKPCPRFALNDQAEAEPCCLPLGHAEECEPGERLPDPVKMATGRAEDGMKRAASTVGEEWFEAALEVVFQYLNTHRTMTSDDLKGLLPKQQDGKSPTAVGSVISAAASRGWCTKAVPPGSFWPEGAIVCMPSSQSNFSPKPLWVSQLYRG